MKVCGTRVGLSFLSIMTGLLLVLGGCSAGGEGDPSSVASGVGVVGQVQAPNGAFVLGGATWRVFQIDEVGALIGSLIATGTTNPDGSFNFNLPTNIPFASNLLAQVENDPAITGPLPVGAVNTLSVPLVQTTVTVNPATEAAMRALVNRPEPLANFTPTEMAQYLSAIEALVAANPPALANLATTIAQISATFSTQMTAGLGAVSGTGASTPVIVTTSLPNGTSGSSYAVTASAVGGTGALTWTVSAGALPAGLALNATTGVLSGTPTTQGTANFTLRVQDSASPTPQNDTQALSMTIAAAPLVITSASPLPVGTVGQPYNHTLTVSGGTPGFAWSLNAGSNPLPAGLTLNAAGLITGTPAAAGTVTVTVKVEDAALVSATNQLTLTINPPGLTITTVSPLVSGTVNQAYTVPLVTSGATGALSWTVVSGALPVGVTLSPSGLLSGTPTTQGTSTFTVRVQDSGNPQQSAQKQFILTVNAATAVDGTLTKTTAVVGVDSTFVTNVQLTSTRVQGNSIVISWGEGSPSNLLEGMDVVIESTGATSVLFATRSAAGTGLWFCSVNFPCQGLTVDRAAGTATFVNMVVVLNAVFQQPITLNGTLTFPPF
jgi:hypothetical protein